MEFRKQAIACLFSIIPIYMVGTPLLLTYILSTHGFSEPLKQPKSAQDVFMTLGCSEALSHCIAALAAPGSDSVTCMAFFFRFTSSGREHEGTWQHMTTFVGPCSATASAALFTEKTHENSCLLRTCSTRLFLNVFFGHGLFTYKPSHVSSRCHIQVTCSCRVRAFHCTRCFAGASISASRVIIWSQIQPQLLTKPTGLPWVHGLKIVEIMQVTTMELKCATMICYQTRAGNATLGTLPS